MNDPGLIKYELGLVVVALIVFWVWQTVSLKRDMKKTAERDAKEGRGGEAGAEES